jgi:hypothetical protein
VPALAVPRPAAPARRAGHCLERPRRHRVSAYHSSIESNSLQAIAGSRLTARRWSTARCPGSPGELPPFSRRSRVRYGVRVPQAPPIGACGPQAPFRGGIRMGCGCHNPCLSDGHERSTRGRPRPAAAATSMHPPPPRRTPDTAKDPSPSPPAPARGGKGPSSHHPRQSHAVAHDFYRGLGATSPISGRDPNGVRVPQPPPIGAWVPQAPFRGGIRMGCGCHKPCLSGLVGHNPQMARTPGPGNRTRGNRTRGNPIRATRSGQPDRATRSGRARIRRAGLPIRTGRSLLVSSVTLVSVASGRRCRGRQDAGPGRAPRPVPQKTGLVARSSSTCPAGK